MATLNSMSQIRMLYVSINVRPGKHLLAFSILFILGKDCSVSISNYCSDRCHDLSINKIKKHSAISNNRLDFIRDANVTRKDARTDRVEDYLEVIYELIK